MAIPEAYSKNFATLQHAQDNGDLALVECTDAKTGQPVYTICAIERHYDEHDNYTDYVMVPLAKMFDGNPYEELVPPS